MRRATILLSNSVFLFFTLFLLLHTEIVTAGNYNMGTYNIRCINSSLTGLQDWDNRKEYVARTITDNKFDVIGIQEIADDAQESDLKNLLPGYTMVTWGRESAEANVGERLAVVFKTESFDMLDYGHYFLTPNPDLPGLGWDATHKRVSVWAKLRDKNNGRIFFYCSTHLDNNGIVARREGARINVEMMNKISKGYPVFIVGDFNAKANEKGVHYTMGAYFEDSRLTSGISLIGPEGTYSGWDPDRSDTKRIDYVYSRLADIESYKVITEDYERGATPSDHFCVIVSVVLKSNTFPQNIYVSSEGNDNNDGSVHSPFRTINKALDIAQPCDTLRVTEGTFFTGASESIQRNTYLKVQCTLNIIGGYDTHFGKIVGYTTLDGDFSGNDVFDDTGKVVSGNTDNSKWLLYVYKPYFLYLENFRLCNAYQDDASSKKGAGIYSAGCGMKLKNIIFTNNNSMAFGGAIKSVGNLEMDSCVFRNNCAVGGGAVYIKADSWKTNILNCNFESNAADYGAVLLIDENTEVYAYGNSFVNNNSLVYGSVSVLGQAINSRFTFINNTFANNKIVFSGEVVTDLSGGSAIYFYPGQNAKIALVNNTVVGNVCEDTSNGVSFKGAAIQLVAGSAFMYNNIIAGNFSTCGVGDICYEKESIVNCMGKNNLYTSPDNISIKLGSTDIMATDYITGISQLEQTLDGVVVDSRFEACVKNSGGNTYTVNVLKPVYGTTPINNLTKRDLNEFYMTFVDLDGGADTYTILERDQIGRYRDMNGHATIGAYEYMEGSGVSLNTIHKTIQAYYSNGYILISGDSADNYKIYDVEGRMVKSDRIEKNIISVNALSPGIYFCVIENKTGNSVCKFIR